MTFRSPSGRSVDMEGAFHLLRMCAGRGTADRGECDDAVLLLVSHDVIDVLIAREHEPQLQPPRLALANGPRSCAAPADAAFRRASAPGSPNARRRSFRRRLHALTAAAPAARESAHGCPMSAT